MFTAIRQRMEREEGFTLIELLVVVIIIGILAAVAIPTFLNQRQRAYRAAVQSDLRNLAVEVETFYTDNQTYVGYVVPDKDSVAAGAQYGSAGVTVTPGTLTASAYCFSAVHSSDSANPYKIQPGNKITTGTCPA